MITPSAALLTATGVALVLLGLAHALLPRVLGWDRDSHRAAGPLSALVVWLHLAFTGLFLLAYGVMLIVAAVARETDTALGRTVLISGVALFGLRAIAEIILVGRVVESMGLRWRRLHVVGLAAWPVLVAVLVTGLIAN